MARVGVELNASSVLKLYVIVVSRAMKYVVYDYCPLMWLMNQTQLFVLC